MSPRVVKRFLGAFTALLLAVPGLATAAEQPAATPTPAATPASTAPAAQPAKSEAPITEAEPEEEAEVEKRARLDDKIRPVSGHMFLKEGRFELSPNLGLSLGDAFFQKYTGGVKLAFHITESMSVGAHASYALNMPGGSVTVCKTDGCAKPELEDLDDVPGHLGIVGGLDFAWAPVYGKVSLAAESVLHFDLYVIGGGSAIQYYKPDNQTAFTFGGHVGIGQRFFISRSMTLRLELRDYIYSAEIVQLGNTNSKIEHQIMFELGLSFFAGSGPQG